MTVTITNQTKNNATLTDQSKSSANMMVTGTPIGLLLALTYAFTYSKLANQSKNAVTLTNQAKS